MPSSTDEQSRPFVIRNASPDLYSDPAFSPDPHHHPFFVTNPDPEPEDSDPEPEPSSSTSHSDNRTVVDSSHSSEEIETSQSPSPLRSKSILKRKQDAPADSVQQVDMPPPYETATRNMIPPPMLESKKVLRAPQRPPIAPRSNDIPPAPKAHEPHAVSSPVTADSSPAPVSSGKHGYGKPPLSSLDEVDELDDTNPLGLSLHHDGPYEAVARATARARQARDQAQRQKHNTPQTMQPHVPLGASLNLSPGQVLPRNFQPYQNFSLPVQNLYQPVRARRPPTQNPIQSRTETRLEPPDEFNPYDISQGSRPVGLASEGPRRHDPPPVEDNSMAYDGIMEEDSGPVASENTLPINLPSNLTSQTLSHPKLRDPRSTPAAGTPGNQRQDSYQSQPFGPPLQSPSSDGDQHVYRPGNSNLQVRPSPHAAGYHQDPQTQRDRVESTEPQSNQMGTRTAQSNNIEQQYSSTPRPYPPQNPRFQPPRKAPPSSVHQSVATTSGTRSGQQRAHVPKQLVMPAPLQQSQFTNTRPTISPPPLTQHPPQFQVHYAPQSSPETRLPIREPQHAPRARDIHMQDQSRKLLRKRTNLNRAASVPLSKPVQFSERDYASSKLDNHPSPPTAFPPDPLLRATTMKTKPAKKVLSKRRNDF